MPLVEISLTAGRSAQQKRALLAEVHDAVERALGVPAPSIRVLLRELPEDNWQAGRVTMAEKRSGTN